MQNTRSPGNSIRFAGLQSSSRLVRVALFVIALFTAGSAWAGTYCAFAFSESTGRYGFADGFDSRRKAERYALGKCGTADASVVGWVNNGYLALAVGPGNSYGTGFGSSAEVACRNALRNCPRRPARVVKWVWAKTY
jgi:hypothetical protein